MASRTIIITGASDGIGAAAARRLASGDDRLILVGRSPEKTSAVAKEAGAEFFIADFAKLSDVRRLAADLYAAVDSIDVLANNAGGIFGKQEITVDGFEKIFQVNHLAPFLLTTLLLDKLEAGEGVVVNTSSSAAKNYGHLDIDDLQSRKKYSENKAYGDAKLDNILFTQELNARYGGKGIRSVAFDPGNIATNFASDTTSFFRFVYSGLLRRLILAPASKGGENLAFFIEGTPGVTWQPDIFYAQTKAATPKQTNPQVGDATLAGALWIKSEQLVGVGA